VARIYNAATGQLEDVGVPPSEIRVDTAMERLAQPDEVQPSDLVTNHPVQYDPKTGITGDLPVHYDPKVGVTFGDTPSDGGGAAPQVSYPQQGEPFPVAGDATGGGGGVPAPAAAAPAPAPAPLTPAAAAAAIGPTVETTTTKLSAESKAGQKDQLAALKDRGDLVADAGEVKVKAAKENADLAVAAALEKDLGAAQDVKDRAAARERLDAAYAERDRIVADAEKQSLRGYWTDKPAGAEVLAILGSAIGTRSAAYLGGRNFAQENLDNAIARDTAAKQAKLKGEIQRMGLKVDQARELYEFGVAEIALRRSVLLDKLADHKAVLDAQHGVDSAKTETAISANDLRMKAGEIREGFGHWADQKVHTSNELQQRAKLAAVEGQAKAGDDPYVLRGTDGQPVVTGTDKTGQPVYVRPHDAKAAETVAAFRDKFPTAMQNLQRLQELAGGSAADRARAVASGEAGSLRHEVALTMATLESQGRAPSSRLIIENEQIVPQVSVATIRDPGKVFGQVRSRMIDRAANTISAQTNANAQTATRLANEWAAGVAGRTGVGEGRRIKYRMADGQVVDAIQRPNGTIEAL
jgi:hypothetical protein